jgi:hypothetical protein
MAKDYSLDKIKNLNGVIKLNYKTHEGDPPELKYYIVRLEWHGKAVNSGASKKSMVHINDGTPQDTEYTPKQIYQRVKTIFGNGIANKLKELYLDLIDDDISEAK